ncbi:alpha/beta hydrolase family protein [Pedobacter cryoconitis]|uniref:Pimeloyl-ACP methyl ester carboxylesterase n=1 Tax=Pedobacter cryoconitis TaxID=188932 RepID=A0A7X0J8E1_9SPHI|nr:alpha/beta hydrolase [Pedobacter cryoconitis]MBB6502883.1 pimeloyl-ACP methyl ester carboxylesterase [Pedobacter cryoconitis]
MNNSSSLKLIAVLLLLLGSLRSHAQSPWEKYFEHYTLADKQLGTVLIHVTKTNGAAKKPLLIYIDGSGNYPLFYRKSSGNYNTSIAFDFIKYSRDYTIVFISKPGTPFSDSLHYESGKPFYPENEIYNRLYSLQWRAGAASKAIDYLIRKIPVDKKHIVVMGYSEGSQVAPMVAVLNKKVTQIVCFVGNAQNQLYDFIINARLDADRNKITQEQGQQIVDSLYTVYEKIYANPKATDKKWFGATYFKWSSFSQFTPLENMLKLDIPILYVAGGKDNNQTIIDIDYAKLEFLRRGKKNLTYKVYPNSNHGFQEITVKDGKETKVDRSDEVHQFAFNWLATRKS